MTIDVVNNNMTVYDAASFAPGKRKKNRGSGQGSEHVGSTARAKRRPAGPACRRHPARALPLRRKPLDIGVLNGHLGYFIRRLQVWVFQDFIRTLAPIDIRPAQYSVLIVIAANPGTFAIRPCRHAGHRAGAAGAPAGQAGTARPHPTAELAHRPALPCAASLTPDGQKTLKRAKMLAALHEARLAEKLGADQRRSMIDVMRTFER